MAEALVGGSLALLGVVLGGVLNHYLERTRRREETILNAKLEIYGKILVGISNSWIEKNTDLKKFLEDPTFNTKMKMAMGEPLSQGRLLAGSDLSDKFRAFFEVDSAIWEGIDKDEDVKKLSLQRGKLGLEIENLMKKDLGTD